jgi:hypothetical protein
LPFLPLFRLSLDSLSQYPLIAKANFTVVMGGFGALNPHDMDTQLKLCQDNGLGVVQAACLYSAACHLTIDQLSDKPGVMGYQISDEPKAGQFKALANVSHEIGLKRPGKLRFFNLFPIGQTSEVYQAKNYDDYVTQFIETVKPDVLSFDSYPPFHKPDAMQVYDVETDSYRLDTWTRSGYRENLKLFRQKSIQYDLPFWNFFNSGCLSQSWGPAFLDPTEGQLAWQAFTSLAYGAKGILYFCWPVMVQTYKRQDNVSVTKTTAKYDATRKVNSILRIFAHSRYLFGARSTRVFHIPARIAGNRSEEVLVKGCAISRIGDGGETMAMSRDSTGSGYLIGQFLLQDGRTALLVNNHDDGFNLNPTVDFRNISLPKNATWNPYVTEVDPVTGEEGALLDDNTYKEGFQLLIPAGYGRLLIVAKRPPPLQPQYY